MPWGGIHELPTSHAYILNIVLFLPMELPEWVDIVKTAMFKELPPTDPDWYYIRVGMPFEGQHGALHENSLWPDHHGDEELH
ncbi:40S ribosomal protein S19 [Hordeum vulgare]|nr:40S ribosomal protein S19 [Hordeum vulgare]